LELTKIRVQARTLEPVGDSWKCLNADIILMNNYPSHFKKLHVFIGFISLIYTSAELYLTDYIWDFKNLQFFLPLIITILSYRFKLFYNPIDFDENFYYHKKGKVKIPISSIQSIKLTNISNEKNEPYWKITYLTNKLETVKISPPMLDNSFAKFIELVKEKNPAVNTDTFEFNLEYGFLPKIFWKSNQKE
jgi:hypothetical protein